MPWEILVDETLVEISEVKIPTTIMLSLASRKQGWNIYSCYGKFRSLRTYVLFNKTTK